IDWASRPVAGDPAWAVGTKPFAGKVVGLLAAAPGALGGVRGLLHLAPLLMQLQCWVAPKQFALAKAGEAFDPDGRLSAEASRNAVHGVVEQVLWAAQRLHA
ncbi:MAG: NADPH-dependent FMN reductase, partial [Hydrogenophaga sp.]